VLNDQTRRAVERTFWWCTASMLEYLLGVSRTMEHKFMSVLFSLRFFLQHVYCTVGLYSLFGIYLIVLCILVVLFLFFTVVVLKVLSSQLKNIKVKGKASSLDIAPLTVMNSGTLQPRKWQLTGNDF